MLACCTNLYGNKDAKVQAASDGYVEYVTILFDGDYGTPMSGWVPARRIVLDSIENAYQYAWASSSYIHFYTTREEIFGECTLDFNKLNEALSTYNKKVKSLNMKDDSGSVIKTITETTTFNENNVSSLGKRERIGSTTERDVYVYTLFVEWDGVAINYYDQDEAEFSGTHENGYATMHTNSKTTLLDAPTKAGYDFGGWYLNDSTCSNASALVTTLSANETYETISLYAKWTPAKRTLTLTCENFDKQQYMIYIYKGGNIYMQFTPTKSTKTITLAYVDDYSATPYKVCFVFGYFGNITFESLTNGAASGRNVTLTTFADSSITYTIATPNINSSIMI